MRIALLQFDIAWEEKATNYDRVRIIARKAADEGADLLCLPELFATGYTMNPRRLAEGLDGETPAFLSGLARDTGMVVIGSFIEEGETRPRNSAIVFDECGEMLFLYSKIHLPSFLHEGEHYEAGGRLSLFEAKGTKMSVVICYDLRFPELFRSLADRGAIGVFVVASWPGERIGHWDVLLRARAIENQVFVFGVNRAGSSPLGTYPGHSAVIDPFGNVLTSAPENREVLLIADVDFGMVGEVRERLPVREDRRLPLN